VALGCISQQDSVTLNRLVFSQVLPSTIGGDAARIWLMARGWMADRKLFSATRPGGWRNGIGDPGRRLLAVDA
jgi:hypothetical protein